MSESLPISAIHPEAPEFLSAAALYRAPIDVEKALAGMQELWNEPVEPVWEEVPAGSPGAGTSSGRLLRFSVDGVLVMMTPVSQPLEVDRGQLPDHVFYVAITCYAPITAADVERAGSGLAGGAGAGLAGGAGVGGGDGSVPDVNAVPVARRKRMVSAHIVLTEVLDCLLREPAAVGVYRAELGVVQPPQMVTELADSLAHGQAPLPLWIGVRIFRPDLAHGRTLGLPLFGHLDLEVTDSTRSDEDIYAMLANIADYIIASDAYLLPGQTVGYRDDVELQLTQATSPTDGSPVLRIQF